jgi:hypothetical protein
MNLSSSTWGPLNVMSTHGLRYCLVVIDHHTNCIWVLFLKSKDDTCPQLKSILLETCHTHARHHSSSGTFGPELKFDSHPALEATATRLMCGQLGVGVHYSAPYAHHMLGKAECPWRTLRDNASAMLHSMSVPNSMWSCAICTVVYLRNRMFSRAVGVSRGVPLTLLMSQEPDASKFRVFGCTVFAKAPNKLRRKLREKRFAASWSATHLAPRGIASSSVLHDALRHYHAGACCASRRRSRFSSLPNRRFPDF